jgi:3-dehydroquinate synthetase
MRGESAYDVLVGSGLLARASALCRRAGLSPRRFLVVVDKNAPSVGLKELSASFASDGVIVSSVSLEASEQRKDLDALARIWQAASDAKLDRSDVLVALGGGLVGDIAGFAAATYRRGIAWVQCPTTLLACVDASVGGKTAINLQHSGKKPLIKNLLGAFHQPSLVISDVGSLASLSREQLSDGLAECIKHACVSEHAKKKQSLSAMSKLIPGVLDKNPKSLAELIAINVAIKAAIAGDDPRENAADAAGGRALLNFGHTFGHVLEGLRASRGASLSHGQAVALGMVAASHASLAMGLCTTELVEEVLDALAFADLPTSVPATIPLPSNTELTQRMIATDKKVRAGKLRIIVPVGARVGRCKVISAPSIEAVYAGWEAIR